MDLNKKSLYQSLDSNKNDNDQRESGQNINTNYTVWKHISDLDVFFTNIYVYHKAGGFVCKLGNKIFEVLQVIFLTTITTIMLTSINYNVLFKNTPPSGMNEIPEKLTFHDFWIPYSESKENFNWMIVIPLIVAALFTLFKLGQMIASIPLFYKIKKFYEQVLEISDKDLDSYTWKEVLHKLLKAQKEHHFCVQKQELTELDVHQRILRYNNYFIGLVTRNAINLQLNVPILGNVTYLSPALKYNLEFILFWGPWSPFVNNWKIHDDFKKLDKLQENAERIKKYFVYMGIVNAVFMPFIFIWQLLNFIYSCAEYVKNDYLKIYKWSLFSNVYLRHFNELDHELKLRLSKAYKPSVTYINNFVSKLTMMLAAHTAFFSGALVVIILLLASWDSDVLAVEHFSIIVVALGACVKISYNLMPNEEHVYDPEKHLKIVIHYIHCAPEHWEGKAHTARVFKEFSKFFESKVVYVVETLLSPFITPYMLIFHLPNNATAIADFFRRCTVEVSGVGDICMFAQLQIYDRNNTPRRINNLRGTLLDSNTRDSINRSEMSFLRFTLSYPNWVPPSGSENFIKELEKDTRERLEFQSSLRLSESILLPTEPRDVSGIGMQLNDGSFFHAQNEALFESLRNSQMGRSYNSSSRYVDGQHIANTSNPRHISLLVDPNPSRDDYIFMPEVANMK